MTYQKYYQFYIFVKVYIYRLIYPIYIEYKKVLKTYFEICNSFLIR